MKILRNQEGFAVVLAIMILAIITLLGFASVQTAITEVQITTNMQIHHMEFYAAESGIAVGHLHAKTAQLDDDWTGWPEDGIIGEGELDGTFYDYAITKGDDVVDSLPDISVYSEGTHPRGGIAAIEATFEYGMWELSAPNAALTVNGGVAKNKEKDIRADDIQGSDDPDVWDIATTGDGVNLYVTNKDVPSDILVDVAIFVGDITKYDGMTFDMPDAYGDLRECKIIVVPNDSDLEDGCGILYIDGSTTTTGSFSWDGLVIVREQWDKTGFSGEINGAVMILNESGTSDDVAFTMTAMTGWTITWNSNYLGAVNTALSSYRMTSWRQM